MQSDRAHSNAQSPVKDQIYRDLLRRSVTNRSPGLRFITLACLILGSLLAPMLLSATEVGATHREIDNKKNGTKWCDYCFDGEYWILCSGDSECVDKMSIVSPMTGEYYHWAYDYRAFAGGGAQSSCSPCGTGGGNGGTPSIGQLPAAEIRRSFHSRFERRPSSFGRYWTCDYDDEIIRFDDSVLKHSDPTLMGLDVAWTDGNNDGVYQSKNGLATKLETLDAAMTIVSDRNQVVWMRITKHNGEERMYEIFYDDKERRARLTSIADRYGNTTTITYQYAVDSTEAPVVEDPRRLRNIATVTDVYNRTFTFHHADEREGSHFKFPVTQIDCPNGTSIFYEYDGEHLSKVIHPDGTESTMTWSTDPVQPLDVLTIQDAAADGTHRNKSVYFTQANWVENGETFKQTFGVTRAVINGAGEVSYASWADINNTGTDGSVEVTYIYRGGNNYLEKVTGIHGQSIIKSEVATNYVHTVGIGVPDITGMVWELEHEWDHAQPNRQLVTEGLDRFGRINQATYDAVQPKLATVTKPDGSTRSQTVNEFGQPLTVIDRLGRQTDYVYDAQGNMLSKTVAVGKPEEATWEWTYNGRGQPTSMTDANGNVTVYEYNGKKFLVRIYAPTDDRTDDDRSSNANRTRFGYNTNTGLAKWREDELGRRTEFRYDNRNRLTEVIYEDNSTEEWTYGTGIDANLVVQFKDRLGVITSYGYDGHGRRISTVTAVGLPEEVEEICEYLDGTELKENCWKNGNRTSYGYDYRNRLVSTTRWPTSDASDALTTTTELDVFGRRLRRTDAYGRSTWFLYDVNDRVTRTITETVPDGVAYSYGLLPSADAPPSGGFAGTGLPGVIYVTSAREEALASLGRDLSNNARYLISETLTDAMGQLVARIDGRGNRTEFTYDDHGRRISTTEAAGSPIAALTTLVYDDQGNVTSITDPRGLVTTMAYTGRNLLAERTVAFSTNDAATEYFTYYADGLQATHVDFRGKTWTSTYGTCCQRPQGQIEPAVSLPGLGSGQEPARIARHNDRGDLTHSAVVSNYDGSVFPTFSEPENSTDLPDGDTITETTTRFDGLRRPVARTVWLGALGEVDANDPPIAGEGSFDASLGLTTRWVYDDDLTDGVGLDTDASIAPYLFDLGIGLNAAGSAVATINPEGERMIQVRDGLGRVVFTTDDENDRVRTDFDLVVADATTGSDLVEVSSTRDPDGLNIITKVRSDGAGRTLISIDAENRVSTFAFDAASNRVAMRSPQGVGEDCQFDERNRETICTDTEGDARYLIYDANSNLVQTVDGRGAEVVSYPADSQTLLPNGTLGLEVCVFDNRNRKIECTDRIGATTDYQYDDNNNLTKITDDEGGQTKYSYDARNLLTQEQFPTHGSGDAYERRKYKYDGARRLVERDDQLRDDTIYAYDFANRLVSRSYPNDFVSNDADTFTYDAASRMLTATSARFDNVVTRSYREDGTLATETLEIDGVTYPISYGYDNAKRVTQQTYPDGRNKAITWTKRDQLFRVKFNGQNVVKKFVYDSAMRETKRVFGNGINENRSYARDDNLVTKITASGVIDFRYDYDANKRKEYEEDRILPTLDQNFYYDDQDRLQVWHRDDPTQTIGLPLDRSWNLSPVGDWDAVTVDGVTDTRVHNKVHELTSRQIGSDPAVALAYDRKGNLTDDGSQTYGWDFENRMITADGLADGADASYRYDAFGRRVQKTVNPGSGPAEVTTFVCAGAQVVAEYIGVAPNPNDPESVYIYGSYVDEPLGMYTDANNDGSDERYYFHANHLYSVAAITDQSKTVVERYGYDAYGAQVVALDDPAFAQPYGFTGRRLDDETGLWYYRTRYYDDELGRFLNRHPWQTLGNEGFLYSYAKEVIPNGWRGFIHSELTSGYGNYFQDRFNLYDFMMNGPANALEPFSFVSGAYIDPRTGQWTDIWRWERENPEAAAEGKGFVYMVTISVLLVCVPDPTDLLIFGTGAKILGSCSKCSQCVRTINVTVKRKKNWPGNDPKKPPEGYEWRGGDKGSWYNPKTGEVLRADLDHDLPIGPHWDYRAPDKVWYRIMQDGSCVPK